ncbi:MAG: hypothetical protein KDE53_40995, partial [Caldilineaceae bacterium]|nr:hypothetical protein [Caldilineaceae bacterium]
MPVQLAGDTPLGNAVVMIVNMLVYLLHIVIIYAITRNRPLPDWHARAPKRTIAIRQTIWLWVYAMVVLIALGGWFNIGLHLPGTIFDPGYALTPGAVLKWAAVNFLFFAALPYLLFQRMGYSNEQLSLRSSNLRADLLL